MAASGTSDDRAVHEQFNDGSCPAASTSFFSLNMSFFNFIGIVVVVYILLKLLLSIWRGIYTCFLGSVLSHTVDWSKLGRWAVITGGTDGIGKAYADELASKGFDIVLISRSPDKLKTVAEEIEKMYVVKTKVISVDFTGTFDIYHKIRQELEGLEIGVLVNNVGMSYQYTEYFNLIPDGDALVEKLININVMACTMMMKIVLPQMEERKKGVVINLSSLSAMTPVPLLSVYAASKAYVNFLSVGVQTEYRKKGIIIQSVLPGFVSTKMSKIRHTSFEVPSAKNFVRWALKTVGVEDKTYGYPAHKLRAYFMETLGGILPVQWQQSLLMNEMMKIRRRYYKKKELKDPMAL
ncbi:very-long-chain 3-oxoacyl-CoA reductase-like [Limulus polyphemus]|uniref:Very-long-chain 3-oxoacyl-CoA reductase-like n=1 Tax=Limulus polyphemus TaxID=6850 RepID=A0ABM1B086_LIMPO|nr:very-long-chain 3-oxoacyl-CoA reductase-like [Limulus polyphemus]